MFSRDNELVRVKMFRMSATLDVSQFSGWLNTRASRNMKCISVTLDVTKLLSGWLNTDASQNMPPMFVTLDVSKLSGWSNL